MASTYCGAERLSETEFHLEFQCETEICQFYEHCCEMHSLPWSCFAMVSSSDWKHETHLSWM